MTTRQKIQRGFAALAAVATLAGAAAAPALAQENRRVKIINETGFTMVRFYASNVSRNNWEEDILGQAVLRNGQSVTVNIDDGTGACRFDFKAVFDDGDELVRNDINVCRISSYRYH
jgi:hypothetical protein